MAADSLMIMGYIALTMSSAVGQVGIFVSMFSAIR